MHPRPVCSSSILERRQMCKHQGTAQQCNCGKDFLHFWWAWMRLSSILCTSQRVDSVTYRLDRAVRWGAPNKTSSRGRTPYLTTFQSLRGPQELPCTFVELQILYVFYPEMAWKRLENVLTLEENGILQNAMLLGLEYMQHACSGWIVTLDLRVPIYSIPKQTL